MRRRTITIAVGIATIIFTVAAASMTLFIINKTQDTQTWIEIKSGIEFPKETTITTLKKSDSGFQNDYVAIYLVKSDSPTADTSFEPQSTTDPITTDQRNHLRDLARIAGDESILKSHTLTHCKVAKAATDDNRYEAIVCETQTPSEWLLFETNG